MNRFLKAVEDTRKLQQSTNSSFRQVISMSLWGSKPRYVYGALRNAQLVPVYFPGWTLRIYVERPSADGATSFQPVPSRIIGKLAMLGAEIIYVDAARSRIPPMMWRFLIADDTDVDIFIVRDSDCRLSDRDFTVVAAWLKTDFAFHCIRDHPSHAHYPVLGGLWGARPRRLKSFIAVPWRDLMMGYRSDYVQDMQFLANAVWPSVQTNAAFCHDSVSCLDWPGAHPFPVMRIGTEHLGQVFDAFGNARDADIEILLENRPLAQCTLAQNVTHDSSGRRNNESASYEAKKNVLGENVVDSMIAKDALVGRKTNENRKLDGSVKELSKYNRVNITDSVQQVEQVKHSYGNKSDYNSVTSGGKFDHIPD